MTVDPAPNVVGHVTSCRGEEQYADPAPRTRPAETVPGAARGSPATGSLWRRACLRRNSHYARTRSSEVEEWRRLAGRPLLLGDEPNAGSAGAEAPRQNPAPEVHRDGGDTSRGAGHGAVPGQGHAPDADNAILRTFLFGLCRDGVCAGGELRRNRTDPEPATEGERG